MGRRGECFGFSRDRRMAEDPNMDGQCLDFAGHSRKGFSRFIIADRLTAETDQGGARTTCPRAGGG